MFNLFQKLSHVFTKDITLSESDESLIILMLILLWILVFCLVPFLFTSLRKKSSLYMWSFSIVGIIICSIYYILNCNIFIWIFSFLMKPQRIFLVFMWLICSILAVVLVQHNINVKKKSNTIIRKPFHALIVMVFLPGILYDFNLLYFSSGCLLGLFLVLEVRFKIYQDVKDCGILALTPICLLIGQTIPLWLYPSDNFSNVPLPLLGGILSVGIGDTFASIGGKFFGKHKWKGKMLPQFCKFHIL
ncbi:conserved hypothetical protein [Pediculus humanus corporis]|uniref:dolichol kinase n=1 Tax=Pediculus humanus subsp. corporis TaxID=121224 RepID=E0VJF1_PEDHC|nr:uncharacterized protein Phum_PHUM244120 [Pediculus humanus corporis]EEB13507.1 conserved hypothetical protein [Pediculus humanus corporis]